MQKSNYIDFYNNIFNWFNEKKYRFTVLKCLYLYLPYVFVLSYIILLIYTFVNYLFHQGDLSIFLKIILIPLISFIVLSIIRKIINEKRPYEKYKITPLIQKKTKGKSMPSRHTFSACIISMSWFYVNTAVGIVFMVLTVVVGCTRFLAGVHYLKDNIVSVIVGIVIGAVYWII